MEANVFITKLKADGSKNDLTNLDDAYNEYKDILTRLAAKDKGTFSLNVLCMLCRNLEKVPSWRSAIDNKTLVTLSIDCTRETRTLDLSGKVKTLACVYHIHRHVVRQDNSVPPELLLKLSYMPFESDKLITEYSKTYWNMIADRIIYIEKLKSRRININKIFPMLSKHILQVITEYNTVQFCSTVLTFLVKKLHYLYSNVEAKELNNVFGKIFNGIQSKSDLISFKKLPDKDLYDIYIKLNDCLYVVAENSSKINYTDTVLNTAVKTCLSLIGHRQDLLHCFQNVYLNGFCSILDVKENLTVVETILSNFVATCEMAEKLGYGKAMSATYPYINQCLRLYIDFNVTHNNKSWQTQFPQEIQIACLKLVLFLLNKLKNCEQLLKCDGCSVKSGLHDALRLSFSVKSFIATPLQQDMSITKTLPLYLATILQQYDILKHLCAMGCINYEKCYRKLQSDVHNTAILLNKSQHFKYSVELFEIYLQNEILHFKSENDMKNISRALYNKSICELDFKQYENALLDAYLSLIFAYSDGLTEKYMSLVMDIKAKILKTKEDMDSQLDSEVDDLQTMTVLDACALAVERKKYGNLKPFFCNLKFSALLRHEFDMYARLWPSVGVVAGVWRSLLRVARHGAPWTNVTDEDAYRTLQEVILKTPSSVRTIHHELFSDIVTDLLQGYDDAPPQSEELRIFHATLTFLKAEFDLAEAAAKHGWKLPEQNDPEQSEATRTLSQEHSVCRRAIAAVHMWSDIARGVDKVAPTDSLRFALQIAQVFVPQLLHLYRTTHGLQLAHACCAVARRVDDKVSFVTNARVLLYHAASPAPTELMRTAAGYCAQLLATGEGIEAALLLLVHCAMYYQRINLQSVAAKLLQFVQSKVYHYQLTDPELNLELAIGGLYEAQTGLCKSAGLSDVIGVHRHYLTVGNNETKWTARRLRSLCLKVHITYTGISSAALCRRLSLWRRARGGAGEALCAGGGAARAALMLATTAPGQGDARIRIDNKIKYILGIPPSSDQPILPQLNAKSQQPFTPKGLEVMLENVAHKTHLSPTFNCMDRIPRFQLPCFFEHAAACQCYICETPYSLILACQTVILEASTYFRIKEYEAARNHFEGCLKCLEFTEGKLKSLRMENVESYIEEIAKKLLLGKFRELQAEAFIEMAFFELSEGNYEKADEFIIRTHEILQENDLDLYLKTELYNLITTAARLRKRTSHINAETNLELELENLKLSPQKPAVTEKTPEEKAKKPPKITRIKAKDEEVPNTKRRVIKLNLDENLDENETKTKRTSKRAQFKIPVPVTAKAVLESMTPKTKKIPDILLTQPREAPSTSIFDFATPKPKNADKSVFFTPLDESNDQFFTPMSTLRTYSKSCLRRGIVKNLEDEFSTPKSDVKTQKQMTQEIEQKSKTEKLKKPSVDKRSLKRATSPGKLEKVEKTEKVEKPRSSRLRKPVKFSLDE